MNARTRKKLIRLLDRLGNEFPDWRFGQLVENVAGWTDGSTWDVEDEALADAIADYLKKKSPRRLAKTAKRT